MEHYYTNNPTSKSEEKIIEYKIKDKTIKFTTTTKYSISINLRNTIIQTININSIYIYIQKYQKKEWLIVIQKSFQK